MVRGNQTLEAGSPQSMELNIANLPELPEQLTLTIHTQAGLLKKEETINLRFDFTW